LSSELILRKKGRGIPCTYFSDKSIAPGYQDKKMLKLNKKALNEN
jgi:hypothetical protein